MSQSYTWPPVSVTATNPSVATNGQSPSATSSTLVAGQNPLGAQEPLQTTSDGSLLTASDPASTTNVNLTEVSGTAITLGQKLSASSLPVVLASDEIVPISAASLPLPSNAAQETGGHLASMDTKLSTINTTLGAPFQAGGSIGNTSFVANAGTNLNTSALALESGGHLASIDSKLTSPLAVTGTFFQTTQPVSGTVTVIQPTGTNLHAVIDSSALPTGASTSANQATANTSLASIVTNTTGLATSANQTTELSRLSGSLVPTAYDEIDLTYSGSDIATAVYKLAGTTVKTLTLTYTSGNLTSVVAS